MVAIVVEAVHEVEGPADAVELEAGCFELEVGSLHKKKGHVEKEAPVKRGRHWQCDCYYESSLKFPFRY